MIRPRKSSAVGRRAAQCSLSLLAMIAAGIPAPAIAQQASADEQAGTPNEAEILVTARRRAERLIDVPVVATAIGEAEIRQYNVTSISNIKIVAPQITFDRGFVGSGASVSLRGVSSSNLDAGLEQAVMLDLDGLPISRGRILNDAMFDIREIDVLKGPQSLFFGKNTPGGVVSIKSADPTDKLEGFARASYEFTTDTSSFEGAISSPITDSFGARLAVFWSRSDGYILNNNPGIVDPFRSANTLNTGGRFIPAAQRKLGAETKAGFRLTLKFDNGGPFDATFKLLGTHYRGQSLASLSEIMSCPNGATRPATLGVADPYGDCKLNNRVSNGFLAPDIVANWPEITEYSNGDPYSRNNSLVPTLTMNYEAGDINLTSVTGIYHYDYINQGNADQTAYSYFWGYSDERNTTIAQEIRAYSSFDGPLNFAAGVYLEKGDRTIRVGAQNGPALRDPTTGKYNAHDNRQENKNSAYSMFGQLTYKMLDNLEVTGGARFTHEKKEVLLRNLFVNPAVAAGYLPVTARIQGSRKQGNVSPEVTVSWHPQQDILVFGAYKTGYLSGGFSNPGILGAALTLATNTYGAQKAEGFEGGMKFQLDDRRLTGSLVGYRYLYKGMQLTSLNGSTNPAIFQTQNAASTLVQGVELEAQYRLTPEFALRGSASYNDAAFRDFPNAQCFTGQTAAQGCVLAPGSTTLRNQDLSGRDLYRSPDWIVTAGVNYQVAVGASRKFGANADIRYSSSYYAGLNLNPGSYQAGYTILNAGVRFGDADDRWTVAVIGRNLTNRRYATIGIDKPGGTGEVATVAGEPRAVVLQLETRF